MRRVRGKSNKVNCTLCFRFNYYFGPQPVVDEVLSFRKYSVNIEQTDTERDEVCTSLDVFPLSSFYLSTL